ncbi:hypothetical protein HPB47_009078 [Ixodes persulcatus]|uniref:Uncharacterized protein n=1 Tax=Ixodes persulcatus TaxID=34615 RepID=A0AC60P351_IXOPE|nr:hypothetical protein HPB47_009078 [Ixodes persulcatus]
MTTQRGTAWRNVREAIRLYYAPSVVGPGLRVPLACLQVAGIPDSPNRAPWSRDAGRDQRCERWDSLFPEPLLSGGARAALELRPEQRPSSDKAARVEGSHRERGISGRGQTPPQVADVDGSKQQPTTLASLAFRREPRFKRGRNRGVEWRIGYSCAGVRCRVARRVAGSEAEQRFVPSLGRGQSAPAPPRSLYCIRGTYRAVGHAPKSRHTGVSQRRPWFRDLQGPRRAARVPPSPSPSEAVRSPFGLIVRRREGRPRIGPPSRPRNNARLAGRNGSGAPLRIGGTGRL